MTPNERAARTLHLSGVDRAAEPRLVAWAAAAPTTEPHLDVRWWRGHEHEVLVVSRADGAPLDDAERARILAATGRMFDARLVRDIRAAGIPYEPETDRLPFPVRHHAALTVSLGRAVITEEESPIPRPELTTLRGRICAALWWIEILGRRSKSAAQRSWFERGRL